MRSVTRPPRRLAMVAIAMVAAIGMPSKAVARDVSMYAGLGAWIDIYDGRSLRHPELTMARIASHGVRTVYVETANSRAQTDVVQPNSQAMLIEAAHAHGMRIVAWYLPELRTPRVDLRRSRAAIRLRTPAGQRFDSFALDIESSAVRPVATRNRRLRWLSDRLRASLPSGYPLGAIIPSPRGMQFSRTFWPAFPYGDLANRYDVMLPMAYSSYHVDGGAKAYDYTAENVEILLAEVGDVLPIHLIGGVASELSRAEVRGIVDACNDYRLHGCSLYDDMTSNDADWNELTRLGLPVIED